LILCSKDKREDKNIIENYYYVYQSGFSNSSSRGMIDTIHRRNRPFVMVIRGAGELEKFQYLVQAHVENGQAVDGRDYNPWDRLKNPFKALNASDVGQGTQRAFEQVRILDRTGFYPGVYHVQSVTDHHLSHQENPKFNSKDGKPWGWQMLWRVLGGTYDQSPDGSHNN